MKKVIAVSLIMTFAASGLFAQDSSPIQPHICILDKTRAADGQTFQSCDAPPENNALLAKGFMIARVDRGTIKSRQPIWAHGLCRYIDNRSPTQDVLVPFGTQEEWKTFNQFVPGIMKVAGCCVPRAATLRDIPEPTRPCIGQWTLQQVVTVRSVQGSYAEIVPDEKMKPGMGDALVSVAGSALVLPMARDDDNTAFVMDGGRDFAARWLCENDEDAVSHATTSPATDDDDSPASHSDVLYVSFTLNCIHEQWTPMTLQTFCVPAEINRAYACDVAGYAHGTPGEVIMYEKTLCPKGTTTHTLIRENCEGEKTGAPALETQPTPAENVPDTSVRMN